MTLKHDLYLYSNHHVSLCRKVSACGRKKITIFVNIKSKGTTLLSIRKSKGTTLLFFQKLRKITLFPFIKIDLFSPSSDFCNWPLDRDSHLSYCKNIFYRILTYCIEFHLNFIIEFGELLVRILSCFRFEKISERVSRIKKNLALRAIFFKKIPIGILKSLTHVLNAAIKRMSLGTIL